MKNNIVDKIFAYIEKYWGCSFDIKTQDFVPKINWWFFCCKPEKSTITNKMDFRKDLKNFCSKNKKILLEENYFLGIWKDEKAYYIDITTYTQNLKDAKDRVKQLWNNEISLYNPWLNKTYFLN